MEQGRRGRGLMLAYAALLSLIGWAAWSAAERSVRIDAPEASDRARMHIDLPDMRVDLNSASAAELSLLPGVGPTLAERIVEYRAQYGPFQSVAELDRVPGVGAAIVERVKPHATITVNQRDRQ